MRIIVCGGRDYSDKALVEKTLTRLRDDEGLNCVLHGGASGADALAAAWARRTGCGCVTFKADWQKYGRAAGPIRNQGMLESGNIDAVVAFPGGRGTADMVRRARQAGVHVIEVGP